MNHSLLKESILALILIGLLLFLINPFGVFMPQMMWVMVVVAVIGVFGLFAAFVWKESVRDERESLHRMIAGRVAFLVGAALLLLGIAVQSISHRVDIWLVVTLVAMIVAKIAAFAYSDRRW